MIEVFEWFCNDPTKYMTRYIFFKDKEYILSVSFLGNIINDPWNYGATYSDTWIFLEDATEIKAMYL
jgi:hypothetical protein